MLSFSSGTKRVSKKKNQSLTKNEPEKQKVNLPTQHERGKGLPGATTAGFASDWPVLGHGRVRLAFDVDVRPKACEEERDVREEERTNDDAGDCHHKRGLGNVNFPLRGKMGQRRSGRVRMLQLQSKIIYIEPTKL